LTCYGASRQRRNNMVISDHALVLCRLSTQHCITPATSRTVHRWRHANLSSFRAAIRCSPLGDTPLTAIASGPFDISDTSLINSCLPVQSNRVFIDCRRGSTLSVGQCVVSVADWSDSIDERGVSRIVLPGSMRYGRSTPTS
jgi:hypothetical protein